MTAFAQVRDEALAALDLRVQRETGVARAVNPNSSNSNTR